MRYLTCFSLLYFTLLCTSVRAQCPTLVWSDEFDAAELNEADWYGPWPRSGEIDIMEWVGNTPLEAFGTIHFGNDFASRVFLSHVLRQELSPFSDDFHNFAVEWTDNQITWYIDGYEYGSRNRADVSPALWPFDRDFYFILNVAVGGTLGGQIDNTAFPTTMEVDYVRVYDMTPLTLAGQRDVQEGDEETYTLGNLPAGATVTWTGPEGADITPGTSSASVVWSGTGGVLTASVTSDCGDFEVSTEVAVGPTTTVEFSFENFDDEALAIYEFSNGPLTEIDNPAPNDVNGSAKVGEYIRDGATQFDVIVYNVSTIENADDYISGDKSFTIDVWTAAPIGTEILLQLETASALPANFPVGRYVRLVATTTVQNEWERLTFVLLDQPDGSASPTSIVKMILLFNSNTFTGDTYFFDNLDSNAPNPSGVFEVSQLDFPFTANPNPANERVQLRYDLPTGGPLNISLFNVAGSRVQSQNLEAVRGENVTDLELGSLPAGVYFARLQLKEGIRTVRLVKQ